MAINTFNQLYTTVQNQTSDTSAAALAIAKSEINKAYDEAISIAGTEDEGTYFRLTTANEKRYLLPEDLDRLRSIQLFETETTGTTDGTTTDKLVDSTASFGSDLVGDYVANTTDNTFARITAVDSGTTLSVDSNIFVSGEGYAIGDGDHNIGREVASENEWDEYNMTSVDYTSNVLTNYFVRKPYIELFPTPVDSNQILVFTYLREIGDLSAADVATANTTTVTQGSTAVTDSGTPFLSTMVGKWIQFDQSNWYKIAGYSATNTIALEKPYQGTTDAAASTTIGEIPLIPKKFHGALAYPAIRLLYLRRENSKMAQEYERLWKEAKKLMTRDASSKTDGVSVRLRSIPKINLDSSKDKLITV